MTPALRNRLRPRILTLLLAVNLLLLLLPLGGLWLLRLYENALVRQTEAELLAQAAVLAAAYKSEWIAAGGPTELGDMPDVRAAFPDPTQDPGRRFTLFESIDLTRDAVLPVPPDPAVPDSGVEPRGSAAGYALRNVLEDARLMTLSGIRIVDFRGLIVASTEGDEGLSLGHQQELQRALSGWPVSTLRERPTPADRRPARVGRAAGARVYVALPAFADNRVLGAVLVWRNPRTIGDALWENRWRLLGLSMLLGLIGVTLALFVSKTISGPIAEIAGQAERTAAGARLAVQPLRHRYTKEVAGLEASLGTIARTLEARADYIRDFAAEVSHEFKTPLTSMKGAIELLEDHFEDMEPAERSVFLKNLAHDVDRLDRLVRRLLELARADVLRPGGAERVDVGAAVDAAASWFGSLGLKVEVRRGPAVDAAVEDAALDAALVNLLENVRQHAGGATAELSWTVAGDRVILRIADDGPGISRGNAAKVFDRFFTTARDKGGTGLGLSIARSQLLAYRATIDLVPSEKGAAFEIDMPLAPGQRVRPAA